LAGTGDIGSPASRAVPFRGDPTRARRRPATGAHFAALPACDFMGAA